MTTKSRVLTLIGGFVLGVWAENRARKRIADRDGDGDNDLAGKVAVYNEGWIAGKNWVLVYHRTHHPDCTSCPH